MRTICMASYNIDGFKHITWEHNYNTTFFSKIVVGCSRIHAALTPWAVWTAHAYFYLFTCTFTCEIFILLKEPAGIQEQLINLPQSGGFRAYSTTYTKDISWRSWISCTDSKGSHFGVLWVSHGSNPKFKPQASTACIWCNVCPHFVILAFPVPEIMRLKDVMTS